MNKDNRKWHSIVLQTYNAVMFETLLYSHNIITESAKSYTFEDDKEIELDKPLRGYFAMKDVDGKKTKYFLEEEYYSSLPIRINNSEELFYRDNARCKSIILRPIDITPFRIKAEKCWESNHEFVDIIAPFEHTHPDHWLINKIAALIGYVGKTFTGVCSKSEFGKSSIYLILDAITKQCPVFQPRSVPGVLAQITGIGNMIFDEVHDANSEVKNCMENFSLQVAGNSPIYINGAMKSKNTKPKYDVSHQSITFLYNVYSNYKNPEDKFWNHIWANKKAMESRFLCLKLDGKLIEKFDKNFSVPEVAETNKMLYVRVAKHLLYLKSLKISNKYVRRYVNTNQLQLKGRHQIIYDEITWGIDLYSDTQAEYDRLIKVLNTAIMDYQAMIGSQMTPVTVSSPHTPQTELVVDNNLTDTEKAEKILAYIDLNPVQDTTQIEQATGLAKIDNIISKLLMQGEIYEPTLGVYRRL